MDKENMKLHTPTCKNDFEKNLPNQCYFSVGDSFLNTMP